MDDSKSLGRQPTAATRQVLPAGSWPPAAPTNYGSPPASQIGVRIPPFMTRRERDTTGLWPLQDFLELGALASAVPCARLHVRQVLWEWSLASVSESTELLVTELITNAVKASRMVTRVSPVRLWLVSDMAQILIFVWDASSQPPVRIEVGGESENGRGLMLVEAISEDWGWCYREGSGGKFVWAIARV